MVFLMASAIVTGCGSHVYHYVKKGETLYSISFRYNKDYRKIAEWNCIRSPYVISVGQRLRVTTTAKNKPVCKHRKIVAVKKAPRIEQPVLQQPAKKPVIRKKESVKRVEKKTRVVSKPDVANVTKPVWRWPIRGRVVQTFSNKINGKKGLDLVAKKGSVIRAAADGRVVYSGNGIIRYGNLLIIKHNDQFLSAYAHNDKLLVKEGDSVKGGQHIANMGSTGSDRVMLHFEIRRNGKPVNPFRYLPR